jgi:hypothetical protein
MAVKQYAKEEAEEIEQQYQDTGLNSVRRWNPRGMMMMMPCQVGPELCRTKHGILVAIREDDVDFCTEALRLEIEIVRSVVLNSDDLAALFPPRAVKIFAERFIECFLLESAEWIRINYGKYYKESLPQFEEKFPDEDLLFCHEKKI